MKKSKHAVSCFKKGFSCSQALLSTYSEQFGLDHELALKVSGTFGGGMGRMGETCGTVTGAFMIIGLKYGKTRAEDEQTKEKAYTLVQEFVKKFKARNGSILCRELLRYDLSTPAGKKLVEEKQLTTTLCPKYVENAAEIIEEILI